MVGSLQVGISCQVKRVDLQGGTGRNIAETLAVLSRSQKNGIEKKGVQDFLPRLVEGGAGTKVKQGARKVASMGHIL